MISENMNFEEVCYEVQADLLSVYSASRLIGPFNAYKKERKRNNVSPRLGYPIYYEVNTTRQNRWLVLLEKAPSESKFKGNPNILLFTYCLKDGGIEVYKPLAKSSGGFTGLIVYKNSVFTRYKELIYKGKDEPLEIAKSFLIENGYAHIIYEKKESSTIATATIKQGTLSGVLLNGTHVVYDKFISKAELDESQNNKRGEAIEGLHQATVELIKKDEFDKIDFDFYADIATHFKDDKKGKDE